MKILVCDDEPVFVGMIAEFCGRFEQEYQIPSALIKYIKGKDVLTYCEKHTDVDIYILDIKMKGLNGMEVAGALQKQGMRGKIIFLTSMIKYALEGYEYGACRYWVKPLSYEKFSTTILTLYKEIKEKNGQYLVEHVGTETEKIYLDDILYVEAEGRKSRIHKTNGELVLYTTMQEYEKKLDSRFFRCHAAYIVNMEHIMKIKGMDINLSDGTQIFISKTKKREFLEAFGNYLNEKSVKRFQLGSVT